METAKINDIRSHFEERIMKAETIQEIEKCEICLESIYKELSSKNKHEKVNTINKFSTINSGRDNEKYCYC